MVWMTVGVLKLCDRYFDKKSAEAIDRQGPLMSCAVTVTIFHAVMCIGFVRLEEFERAHPRIVHETDIEFSLAVAPPDPDFRLRIKPPPKIEVPAPNLVETKTIQEGGSTAAVSGQKEEKVSSRGNSMQEVPKVVIQKTAPLPFEPPPVLVKSSNQVKANTFSKQQDPVSEAQTGTQQGEFQEPVAGGKPDSLGETLAINNTGAAGVGNGTSTGVGNFAGTSGPTQVIQESTVLAQGNIRPYKLKILNLIAQEWAPTKAVSAVVLINLAQDGTLISAEVLGCSRKKAKKEILEAIERVTFPSLPEWYKKDSLAFKLDLTVVDP